MGYHSWALTRRLPPPPPPPSPSILPGAIPPCRGKRFTICYSMEPVFQLLLATKTPRIRDKEEEEDRNAEELHVKLP